MAGSGRGGGASKRYRRHSYQVKGQRRIAEKPACSGALPQRMERRTPGQVIYRQQKNERSSLRTSDSLSSESTRVARQGQAGFILCSWVLRRIASLIQLEFLSSSSFQEREGNLQASWPRSSSAGIAQLSLELVSALLQTWSLGRFTSCLSDLPLGPPSS